MVFTHIDRNNNMNMVRYVLCLEIILHHFNVLTETQSVPVLRFFDGVGSFFAMSGFLMFASYEKNSRNYFGRRIRRILPPYVVIVLLAAVGLSCVSTLSFGEYFTNGQLYRYLLCNLTFLNFLEPDLPGVFSSGMNHLEAVNGSLWTMKGEIACYLLVPLIFALIRRHPHRATSIVTVGAAVSYICFVALAVYDGGPGSDIAHIIARQFRVIAFFFIGAILNLKLQLMRRHRWTFLVVALAIGAMTMLDNILYLLLQPIADSMLVIWCCMIGSWGHFLAKCDDMTYDMYLFHFPIIQTLIATGVVASTGLLVSLGATVAATMLLSWLSGRYIGTPIASYPIKKSNK